MPYYSAGDYYRGDYYRGDNYAAGGLSLKGIVKGVAKIAGAALSVTPAGKVISAGIGLLKGKGPSMPAISPSVSPQARAMYDAGVVPDVDVPMAIPAFGGEYIYDSRGRRKGDTGRKGHFKKDGTWTNRARPRMNPGNMRALRRANRRAHSFLRAYRSAVRYFVAKSPKGKAYVHFRAKKK